MSETSRSPASQTWAEQATQHLPQSRAKNTRPAPPVSPNRPAEPPAKRRAIQTINESELAKLRTQISELADKLAQQTTEIAQLRSLLMNLTDRTEPQESNPVNASTALHPYITPPPPTPQKPVRHANLAQWKERTPPQNPLHRNSSQQYIIDIPIPRNEQRSGQIVVDAVNQQLAKTPDVSPETRIAAVLYSKNGRPILLAAPTIAASKLASLLPVIFTAIFGRGEQFIPGHPDRQQFRLKLNGVPTKGPDNKPLNPLEVVQKVWNSFQPPRNPNMVLGQRPHWLGQPDQLAQKTHASIMIPFRNKEDAILFLQYRDFLVYGEQCRASPYTDTRPPRQTTRTHPPDPGAPPPEPDAPEMQT